jgi:hypothetical protein
MTKGSDWRKFERHVREKIIPDMRTSQLVMLISPDISAEFDVRFAVQIGAAVLLEKPLVVIVPAGSVIAPKLERVADRIIRGDSSTEEGREALRAQMERFLADFGRQ